MNTFVFQSTPERYDLRSKLSPTFRETWYATRYRSEMHCGDIVLFWMAGDEHFRGLYGWGVITSEPYLKEDWKSHGVDIEYQVKFTKPILARTLRDDPTLSKLLIFRAPQATNFLLKPSETKSLFKVIKDRGEIVPSIEGAL